MVESSNTILAISDIRCRYLEESMEKSRNGNLIVRGKLISGEGNGILTADSGVWDLTNVKSL